MNKVIILLFLFLSSCSVGKKRNDIVNNEVKYNKDSSEVLRGVERELIKSKIDSFDCKIDQHDCLGTYMCYKDLFQHKDYVYNDKFNNLLKCSVELSQQNNIEVERDMVGFFDRVYHFLYTNNQSFNKHPSLFSHHFEKLRSPEAFEVVMKYARHGSWDDPGDDVGNSHSGIMFIRYVVYPMIKTIDGVGVENYLTRTRNAHPEKYKYLYTGINGGDSYYANLIHKDLHKAILEAWKSGKIVLKKYGE